MMSGWVHANGRGRPTSAVVELFANVLTLGEKHSKDLTGYNTGEIRCWVHNTRETRYKVPDRVKPQHRVHHIGLFIFNMGYVDIQCSGKK